MHHNGIESRAECKRTLGAAAFSGPPEKEPRRGQITIRQKVIAVLDQHFELFKVKPL
jgi:hypothetical protein